MSEHHAQSLRYSIVVPVFNEANNIDVFCRRARAELRPGYELILCYDREDDSTLSALRGLDPSDRPDIVRTVKNDLGSGVRFAIEAGMRAARAPVVVVMMADLSDDFSQVETMVASAESGVDVVCGSRYMSGGRQIGGPRLKKLLSRTAGISLHWLTGLPTSDPTNSFKAYRRDFLQTAKIETGCGFALGLELTVKAHCHGGRVNEVPVTWQDRQEGTSRFRLLAWLPQYLRWYVWGLNRSRRAAAIVGATLFAAAVVVLAGFFLLRQDVILHEDWLLGEEGNQLWRANKIREGGMLYRDVACQYGPLPTYLYAAATSLAGNSPQVNAIWHVGIYLMCLAVAYRIVRQHCEVTTSALWSVTVLSSLFLPYVGLGAYQHAEYVGLEKLFLLVLTFVWRPPSVRSHQRTFCMGLLLGVLQWIKFGSAVFAGAAILLLDGLSCWKTPVPRSFSMPKRLTVQYALLAAAAASSELALVVWALSSLPRPLAIDTLWPAYMLDAYRDVLFPASWQATLLPNAAYFFGRQLIPYAAVCLAGLGIIVFLASGAGSKEECEHRELNVVLPGLFYLTALGTYIAHPVLSLQHLWAAAFPGIWLFRRLPIRSQLLFAMLFLPSLGLTGKILLWNRPETDNQNWTLMPSGDKLMMNAEIAASLSECFDATTLRLSESGTRFGMSQDRGIDDLESLPDNEPAAIESDSSRLRWTVVVDGWRGGGVQFFYQRGYPFRTPFLPGRALRPYDAASLIREASTVRGVLVGSDLAANYDYDIARILAARLPEPVAAALTSRRSYRMSQIASRYAFYQARPDRLSTSGQVSAAGQNRQPP